MSVTLVFLALLMAAIVWWLVKQTVNVQPWSASSGSDNVRNEGVRSPLTTVPLPNIKLGLGVFLAVATSLFALFISAYSIRMEYMDWRPMPEPALLWVNSGILVLSSVFLQWAWNAANRQEERGMKLGLALGGACAVLFIGGQLMAWEDLTSKGHFVWDNPANAFFYLLTGAHALHLLGGLVAWWRSVKRVWGDVAPEDAQLGIELCAVYWHYLLAVWFVLFGLLLST